MFLSGHRWLLGRGEVARVVLTGENTMTGNGSRGDWELVSRSATTHFWERKEARPLTSVLDDILDLASRDPKRIVMSEGEDRRIVEGALRAARDGLAQPILVGRGTDVARRLREAGARSDDVEVVDLPFAPDLRDYAAAYLELRKHKGVDEEAAARAVADPLVFSAMMVRQGQGDGTIGGAVATTGDTVRTAFQVIGLAPGVGMVSSFFLMLMEGEHHPVKGALAFADCGLIVEPSVDELEQIAISSADSFRALTGNVPRVAMLSFSTIGSARHARVDHVVAATEKARTARPDLTIDGEIQFDAAFVPSVAERKAPGSPLGGAANVFVFPNLEAANIGYKIAQRIGGAKAIGPILQGLARPANDLSRGCSAEDVHALIAVTGVQASRAGRGP